MEIPAWEPLAEPALSDQRGTADRMRAACPLARSAGGVTLFRHADVVAAALDPATFSSAVSAHRQVPNSLDPPEHTAFREAIDPFFSPERLRALEPALRVEARDIVSRLPRSATVDAVRDLGYPFAVRAQAAWLGWQGVEATLLAWMHDQHEARRSGDRSRTAAVAAVFDEIVAAQVRSRRAQGRAAPDDPTTALLHARVNGRTLADEDIVSILRNWTAGDLGSMAASIGVVVHFIAAHADIQAGLRADASDLARAIDEMLRIDDPFLFNRRIVTRRTQVAGFDLEPGTVVSLHWASANRDEGAFGEAAAYRPVEHASGNVVYGAGIHACPGRPLATLELVIALETLLASTAHVQLAPDAAPQRDTYPVGGWRRVPIRLS